MRHLLTEAAGARADRNFRELAGGLDRLSRCPDAAALDALAARARAMLAMEGIALAQTHPFAGSATALDSFLTRQQLAWPAAVEVTTSLMHGPLQPAVASAVAALMAELMAWIAADARPGRPVRVFVASEVGDGEVTFAFAAHGIDDLPVPGAAASRAIRRAERLASLVGGGMVRGFRDGLALVGLNVLTARHGGAGH